MVSDGEGIIVSKNSWTKYYHLKMRTHFPDPSPYLLAGFQNYILRDYLQMLTSL